MIHESLLMGGRGPEGQAAPNSMMVFMPYLIILGIFYFLLIRPQQKRAQEHRKFVEGLAKGDAVITESGLYGTVASVHEDAVVLKVDDSVKVRFLKVKIAGPAPAAKSGGKQSG
jgi:preprotein translocase subunit YajC